MNSRDDDIITGPVATRAWKGLICLIGVVGIAGILFGGTITPPLLGYEGTTPGAALAAIAAITALGAAVAVWNGKRDTGSVLAITAAISTAVGFLVSEIHKIHVIARLIQFDGHWWLITWLIASTIIVITVGIISAVLTVRIFQNNGES